MNVYWFDARYDPSHGNIEVYAKTEEGGKTCCLVFKDIQQDVYAISNSTSNPNWTDICEEAKQLLRAKLGYNTNQVLQAKFVWRHRSVFQNDATSGGSGGGGGGMERAWKLSYSARAPVLQQPIESEDGRFSVLPGGQVSPLTLFLMNRKMKGPGWIRVCGDGIPPSQLINRVSDCQLEFHFPSPKHTIAPVADDDDDDDAKMGATHAPPPPSWRMLCLDMFACQGFDVGSNTVFEFERKQLGSILRKYDPDIVFRHQPPWEIQNEVDLLGRSRTSAAGRLFCSTSVHSKDHMRSRTNDLEELLLLATQPTPTGTRAELTWKFVKQSSIVDYTLELSKLSGSLWSNILRFNHRSQQCSDMLMHAFHQHKYILPPARASSRTHSHEPEQEIKNKKKNKKQLPKQTKAGDGDSVQDVKDKDDDKEPLRGGLVLEPRRGLYNTGEIILLLDFRSLYPSIIQEFNLCFSNPKGHETKHTQDLVLPQLVGSIVSARRLAAAGSIRERALKFLANSMYGCLTFHKSPFYSVELAATITAHGRSILEAAVAAVGKERVIYGHTDSLMVTTEHTDLELATQEATKLVQRINAPFKIIRVRVQAFIKSLLLVGKNRHAAHIWRRPPAATNTVELEMRGLEAIRRDWSLLSHDISLSVLDVLLLCCNRPQQQQQQQQQHMDTKKDAEPSSDAAAAAAAVDDGSNTSWRLAKIYRLLYNLSQTISSLPVAKFVQTMELSRDWDGAGDNRRTTSATSPHVRVALDMQPRPMAGQRIGYVICAGSEELGSIADRAVAATHLGAEQALDIRWYLEKQVLDPVDRLCTLLKGWSREKARVALGLDRIVAVLRV